MASITFIISGGVPDYTVEIVEYGISELFPAEGDYVISGDFSGCFTLRITDANGCIAEAYDCCPTITWDAEFISHTCEQTWECDLDYNILEISFLTTTTTSTTSTSSTTTTTTTVEPTTTTTTIEPTTTTTTTTLLCEPMICDTTLTVGTDGNGNYGFFRGVAGSISPDCGSVNAVGYMDSQGLLGVVLIDYVCDVTLWINGVEYELTYFGYIPEYGGNAYFIPLVPNPFPSIGETCNVAICGTECTTTTTTEEPTTTTTTTTCDPSKCDYGLLYNWYAVDTGKLAPTGWHIPTSAEWEILAATLESLGYGYGGSGSNIAFSMASKCDWNRFLNSPTPGSPEYDPPTNNSTEFNIFPCGSRDFAGDFVTLYWGSGYWVTDEYMTNYAYGKGLASHLTTLQTNIDNKKAGRSIRYIKDDSTNLGNIIDFDGNVYSTIKIGTQVWTVENLKVTHYNDGEIIPNIENSTEWSNLTTGALCAYDNDWETYVCVPEPTTTTTTTTP